MMIANNRHPRVDRNKARLKQLASFGPIFRDPKKGFGELVFPMAGKGTKEDPLVMPWLLAICRALRLLALFGHGAMSDMSQLSGVKRKLDFGVVRSAFDPNETWAHGRRGVLHAAGQGWNI